MRLAGPRWLPATDDLAVAHEDGADQRVGMGAAAARLGQCERALRYTSVVHA